MEVKSTIFILILSICFINAIPLTSSSSADSSDDLAEERAKRQVSYLEESLENGGLDRLKREAIDDNFRESSESENSLEQPVDYFNREIRAAEDEDKGGDEDEGGDEDDLGENTENGNVDETDEGDDDDDDEDDNDNDDDDDEEDDDDDEEEDDSEDRQTRGVDENDELERELSELDELTESRKRRDVAPKPTVISTAGTKPPALGNTTTKCTRSITLEDLDKLLEEADSEQESRNKRNMEDEEFYDDEEEDDDEDDEDEDLDDFLSRKRRDLTEEEDDEEEEDDDDDDDEDTEDDDEGEEEDEEEEEDDDDKDEENDDDNDGARKRRSDNEMDDADTDDDDQDAYIQNLMRIMRDTDAKNSDENSDVEDKNTQVDSDIDQINNSPEGFQNLAKREDYDYAGEDLDSDIEKRDEEFNQGLSEGAEENSHRFLDTNEEKSKRKPFVSSIIIDEADNFSLIESGNETKIIMNNSPDNVDQKSTDTTNAAVDSYQPGYTNTPDFNENTVHPDDDDESDNQRLQRSKSQDEILEDSQGVGEVPEESFGNLDTGIKKKKVHSHDSALPKNAAEPRGPIALENKLTKDFAGMFNQNPKADIQWVEPDTLSNCWVHAMLAHTLSNGFSPSCNQDGSYSPKQCYLQRCWCVSRDGSPEDPNFKTRFTYAIKGAMLKCTQVYR